MAPCKDLLLAPHQTLGPTSGPTPDLKSRLVPEHTGLTPMHLPTTGTPVSPGPTLIQPLDLLTEMQTGTLAMRTIRSPNLFFIPSFSHHI